MFWQGLLKVIASIIFKEVEAFLLRQQYGDSKRQIGMLQYENKLLVEERARSDEREKIQDTIYKLSDDDLIERVRFTNARINASTPK